MGAITDVTGIVDLDSLGAAAAAVTAEAIRRAIRAVATGPMTGGG